MKKLLTTLFVIMAISTYGQDDSTSSLKQIEDTDVKPFNKICHQHIRRNKILWWGGWAQSTGFFIDRNFILTAAHNVHSQFLSNVKEIQIKIGRNGDEQLHKTITILGKDLVKKHVKTPDEYGLLKRVKKKRKWDFAIIYIPDSLLPSDFEWKNEFVIPNKPLKVEKEVQVAGYPADLNRGFDGGKLFHQMGNIKLMDKYYTHNYKTAGGNSGSPVWVTVGDNNEILGIHTFSGSGTLIDDENLKTIQDWMEELKNYP